MGITINVVRFGEKEQVEVEEGATFGDVLAKIGETNAEVKNRGVRLQDKAQDPVRPGDNVTVAPKTVKQGKKFRFRRVVVFGCLA